MSNEPDIRKIVLEKIRAGNVKMRSRSSFVFRRIVLGLAALVALALSLLVLSFAFFSVRKSGVQYLLQFGAPGFMAFIALFPWTSLLLFLLLLLALELLMRRFTSAYRFSLLRIFGWVFLIGTAGSVLLDFTPLHASLLSATDKGQLPLLAPLYEQVHTPHLEQGVFRGKVTSVGSSTIIISHDKADRDTDEGSWTIVPPAGAPPETFSVGEKLFVGGRKQDGMVHAYGIHKESRKGRENKRGSEKDEKDTRDKKD